MAQRGQLDQKLEMLHLTRDLGLLPGLMAGPIRGYAHIYKLQVGGKVRLRPFLCRGPVDMEVELTLLAPATERDGRFDPRNAPDQAAERRLEVIDNDGLRAKYVFPES